MTGTAIAAARKLRSWREHRGILRFAHEELKVEPDAWQEETLLAFASPAKVDQRISLQACVGPGKSAVLAWCGWWFLSVQGDRDNAPKGLATAITGDNLRANLWTEYAKWQKRSTFLSGQFTWTSKRIFNNDDPEEWFIEARSFPKTANADEQGKTLSGLHSKYVLAQIDESGAIPMTVARAAEQALSNCIFGKILQAGNPISLDGMLYVAATSQRHLWHVIRITSDPDDPRRSHRIDLAWALEQIALYGRENPWVKATILGEFPPASINALLGVEEVERAMGRHYARSDYELGQKRLGVDIARFGDDRTVIFPRQGVAAFRPLVMRAAKTDTIAGRIVKGFNEWNMEGDGLILIDDSGHWGHGVVDQLQTAGYPIVPVLGEDEAIDKRYKNRRCEMWLEMAKWIRAGGALPKIEPLIRELVAPTYTFLAGKFVLEPKDQIKKRLGFSPDLADALGETFALPDMPGKLMQQIRGRATTVHDFDPYANPDEVSSDRVVHNFNPFEPR
jgi:phage terminase large subunit